MTEVSSTRGTYATSESKGRLDEMQPRLKLAQRRVWAVSEQRVSDPVSGLTFEFLVLNDRGECRLKVTGPQLSRFLDFTDDGCVTISSRQRPPDVDSVE